MNASDLMTVGQLARELDAPQHRVVYLLNSRNIEPTARIGNLRVFGPAAREQLRHELRRIDRERVAFA